MTKLSKIEVGAKVLVPAHRKPMNAPRPYSPGTVVAVDGGWLTVALDCGRTVHVARGIVQAQ